MLDKKISFTETVEYISYEISETVTHNSYEDCALAFKFFVYMKLQNE